jgi:hypothetical protein
MAATNTIQVGVNVSDNGTVEELQKKLKELKREFSSLKNAMRQTEAGSAGAMSMSSKQENIAYRNARGVAGTGGGDSRDFAKQAQGLGGLVHVYATFAANIFAVGAAFNALSKAMANANMLAAADQLSSTLGVNVKVLASDIQKLTGYTLSLQDTIKAVNVGLQSGISSKNIKELVVIAKGAANVMGRDMADSIDRVIRGTAKQEQEILDELGIIVRSKQAWDDYAKTIGKSGAEALTAAEKQEGYTRAVIKAGQKQKEFADSFSNPYDKLLASITEVGNAMLNGLNAVFGPIANYLAGNKAAIFSIISALTAFLLTKAIPTLRIIGDNLEVEREKNLANSKKLVDSYSKQGALFNEKERTNIKNQLDISTKDFESYGTKVKATFASIASNISKSNVELRKTLQMDPSDLAANADKLKKQLNRTISGLTGSITSATAGTGKFAALDEEGRLKKVAELELRRLNIEQQRNALFSGEDSHLSKMTAGLEGINALEAKHNALKAEGGAMDAKSLAAIDAINLKQQLRSKTLEQSQKFADVLNNPISTMKEKASTFFGGFGQVGNNKGMTAAPGAEGPMQPKNIGILAAGVEKATYGMQALSLAGEAVIGVLGKIFIWFTIITTVWSVVTSIVEYFKLWTDHSEKIAGAQKDLNSVLDTQKKMLEKNKELLTSTDLDSGSYISKWKMLSENFSQITDKLKEMKTAQDEYNKSAGGINKFWDNITGTTKKLQEDNITALKNTREQIGVSKQDQETIDAFFAAREKAKPKANIDELGSAAKLAQYNRETSEKALALNIKINENSANMAETNKVLMKSFEGLGDAANEAYSKAFDKKSHKGFASEVGETLNSQLIKPFDNLIERYKSGAISQEAFANGMDSFRKQLDMIGPGIKEALPAFEKYLKAVIAFDAILNAIKTKSSGESISDAITRAAKDAEAAMNSKEFIAAYKNVQDAAKELKPQIAALKPPKEAATSGLSTADRSQAKKLADDIKVISTEIKTSEAKLKDATALNSRIAAVRGYNTELELTSIKTIETAKAEQEFSKSKAQAELDYFKIKKDVGSSAQVIAEAEINKNDKIKEAQAQKNLEIKRTEDLYKSGIIDNYIKKNNQILDVTNLQIDAAQSYYDNLQKLDKLSVGDKINIDGALKALKLTEKFNADIANLNAQAKTSGSEFADPTIYEEKRNKLQDEYNLKLQQSIASTKTETDVLTKQRDIASTENQITAIQNRIDMEREAGINSTDLINQRAVLEEQLFQKKMLTTDVEAKQALEIQKTNKLYKDQLEIFGEINKQVQSVGDTLTTVFGNLGTAIGGSIKALVDSAQDLKKIDMEYAAAKKDAGSDPKALADAEIKYSKEKSKAELNSISSVAGASKKLFNEKSAGYKVLAKVEKAAAAVSLALQLKDLAVRLGILGTKVSAEAASETAITGIKAAAAPAQVAADTPGILSSFSKLGPVGYAAGAAIVAMLLSMVGGGGGKMVDMAGLTSEDRQATQGTGQSYVGGVRVDNGLGVFGDSSAKSTAIADSLGLLADNSIVGLNYDNKMLKALEKLADSIVGAAKSLYSIPGLRAGTGFGTQAGTTIDQGFASSIPLIGGVLGGIFGGDTTAESSITSAGLLIKGSFDDVMNNITGSILQYKDVLTKYTEDGGWFGSDDTWSTLTQQTTQLASAATSAISDIFKDANALFIEIGKKTDVSAEVIASTLKTLNASMTVDLMGLTGDALVTELNAIIGNTLSSAAKVLFAGFQKYQNFGEDYIGTVLRVLDANNKVDQALRSIGGSFSIIGKFDISEAMVKLAGGLSNFMEQTAAFNDSFLTDAERLVPVQKDVVKQLVNLGLSSTLTREQFKQLVISQDLSTAAGQAMYQSLMELVPGFDMVTKAAEALAEDADKAAKALAASKLDFDISIYTELGMAEKALELTRQKELDALDATLRPIQIYLNSLKDETSLKAKLTKAYTDQSNAIKNTISSLTNSIKSLRDYRAALTSGSNSLLTPTEKYSQARATMFQTAAAARTDITASSTPEEIAARNDAISKLSSTTDAFLNASKELFASSDRYTQDYSSVLALIDSTSSSLTDQLSNAEKQLAALDESVSFLNLIATSTDTTASLLKEMVQLQKATEAARLAAVSAGSEAAASVTVPGLASGGMASGLTIVGENGPELANFTSQARVYSNPASNDIFNTAELVSEIKSLRKEVSQLRADQKEQTGHLIAANYDANAKNAEMVAESTDAALASQSWKVRSQVKIA